MASRQGGGRRWLRRLIGAAAGLVLLCAAAYATLPWWVPGSWLADRLAAELSRITGRPVSVERVTLGWRQGVVAEGVLITRKPAYGGGRMLRVGRATCGLTPLRTLWTGRIDRLQIAEADCWAVIGPDGRLNLTDLGGQGGSGLPTNNWRLSDLRLHVISDLPDQAEITVEIGSLACQLDPATGRADYRVDATLARAGAPAEGAIRWDGQLLVPRLNPRVTLSGGTRFEWRQLDLSSLPVRWWPRAGLERLAGRSGGRLVTRTDDKRGLLFELEVQLEDVEAVRRDAPGPDRLGDASLWLAGSYHAPTQELVLDRFRYEVPGRLVLHGPQGSDVALAYAPRDRTSLRLDLVAHTPDLAELLRISAASRTLRERGIELGGPCRASLVVAHGVDQTRCRLSVDATGVTTGDGSVVRHTAGTPAELELSAVHRHRESALDIEEASLRLGDTHLDINGLASTRGLIGRELDLVQWALALIEEGRFGIELRSEHIEEIAETVPVLRRRLADVDVAGPVRLRIDQRPIGDKRHLEWLVSLPAGSTCRAATFIDKPAQVALEVSGGLVYPGGREGDKRGKLGVELTCGRGRLTIGRASSSWQAATRRWNVAEAPHYAQADAPIAVDLYADLPVDLENVEELIRCVPWLADRLGELGGEWQRLRGGCRLGVTVNASLAPERQRWRLSGRLHADELEIEFGRSFRKRADAVARARAGWAYDSSPSGSFSQVDVDAELAGARADASWQWSGGRERHEVSVSVGDVASFVGHFPAWSRSLRPYRLKGAASARLLAKRRGSTYTGRLELDLTGGGFDLPASPKLVKRRGIPLTATTRFSLNPQAGANEGWRISVNDLSVNVGSSELLVPAGYMRVAAVGRSATTGGKPLPPEGLIESARAAGQLALTEAVLDGKLSLRLDGTLQASSDRLGEWMRRHDVAGSALANLSLRYADGDKLALQWQVDASGLHFNAAPDWMKPAGSRASAEGWAHARLRPGDGGLTIDLGHLSVRLGRTILNGVGSATVLGAVSPMNLAEWSFRGTIDAPQVDEWATLRPKLAALTPRGSTLLNVSLRGSEDGVTCESVAATFSRLGVRLADSDVTIDGDLSYTDDLATTDGLRIRAGRSDAAIIGRIYDPLDSPRGELLVYGETVDLDQLSELLDRARAELAAQATGQQPRVLAADRFGELFRRAMLSAAVRLHKLWFTEPTTKKRYLVDELSGVMAIANGRLSWPLRCCLNGGLVEGRVALDPYATPPRFDLTYEALAVAPADAGTGVDVRPYLELTFPGMIPTGPITLIDETRQILFRPQHPDNYPVGSGELIIEGGIITGKAAPDYITQILPQLDFARFEFRRMHDWFQKHADGRVDHHMVFQGKIYHIYADGYSTADRRIHYEVGVDFLATFDKQSWAETGQGRLPLFVKDALVGPDGTLINERVRYVSFPKLVKSIFVSNTLIETSYLALREQISRMRK